MAMRPLLAVAAAAALAGCDAYPQLDATVSGEARRSPYPALMPVEDLRAAAAARPSSERIAAAGPGAAASPAAEIDARAARLRARAAGLRGEVIDAESKERLNQPVEIEDDAL